MSFVKVYVHCVWTTKNRYPFLNDHNIRNAMWSHIIEHGRQKGIYVDFINGYTEHCHCLIALSSDQTLQKSLQLLKGESSYWANRAQLTKEKFEWQNEYYAVSISPVELNAVRDYINNQEEHHRKITFQEEYNNLINEWGFVRYVDGRLLV